MSPRRSGEWSCDSSLNAMLDALSPASSGAAEAFEEALLRIDDPGDPVGLRCRVPLVELERAAEQDAVGAREHVTWAASECVADLRLRLEDHELPARRVKVRVAEQLAAAEAGTVQHQRFGKCGDICRLREAPHLDFAAGELHVAEHLAKVAARLHIH